MEPTTFPALIAALIPGAAVAIDRPLHDDGEWWFDIRHGSLDTQISWHPSRGFGLYLGAPGYGERPTEIYSDPNLAARRICQMIADMEAGEALAPMAMGQVRRLLGRTQADIAAALHIRQANVSRLESRANPTLGSVRALVEAMGGELEVRAKFPGLDVPIALPASEAET